MNYRYLLFLLMPHFSYSMGRVVQMVRPVRTFARNMATLSQLEKRLAHLKAARQKEDENFFSWRRQLEKTILDSDKKFELSTIYVIHRRNRIVALEESIFKLEWMLSVDPDSKKEKKE